MFESVLVANRGEIARRVIRTARRLGIRTVAVYSELDASLPFVHEADEAVKIGTGPITDSYLNADAVLAAAHRVGAASVHPGYGLLSENSVFAQAVVDAGIAWFGPSPKVMGLMSDKIHARNSVEDAGLPVLPGCSVAPRTLREALSVARDIGFPIMLKLAAGGGGIGMYQLSDEGQLKQSFERAADYAQRAFGSPDLLLEHYVARAHHVEVQILGCADGHVISLGERECSVQRRHQRIIEEAPSPTISDSPRSDMLNASAKAAEALGYTGAGTFEFHNRRVHSETGATPPARAPRSARPGTRATGTGDRDRLPVPGP